MTDGHRTVNTVSGTVHGTVMQAGTIVMTAAPGPTVPRQIRGPRRAFVNREGELARLEAALGRLDDVRPAVVVFTGLGGVGKTELVAQFAARSTAHFPGGQLYADLAAHRHHGGADLGEVLGGFLRGFGLPYVPDTLAERAAAFRTATAAGRRVLVFLDNVEHAAEVRALLPATGLLVAAGRRRLPGLALDGAELLRLDPLTTGAGSELVRGWLGPGRGTDDELARLVEFCGGLPLALNAVGFRLLDRDELRVDRVLAELTDKEHRLSSLSNEEGAVGDVLDTVHGRLPEHTRQLYRLLGVNPGPLVSAELAEAVGVERVADGLAELRSAHLLDDVAEEGPERRYRAHDLVRLHAAGVVRDLPGRRELLAGIVAYYRGRAALADRAIGDRFRLREIGRLREGGAPPAGGGDAAALPGFGSGPDALQWLQSERANLLGAVRAAAEQGWHGEVWRLCESLWPLYHGRKHYGDWVESHLLAVEAAQWDNRPDAVIRMRNQLGRAYYEQARYPLAAEQLAAAAALLPQVDEPRLAGVLWETDGLLCLADGRPERAVELFTLARQANEGDAHGVVVQSYNLAQALVAAGRAEEALAVLGEAGELAEREGDAPMLMRLPLVEARAERALHRPAAAVGAAERGAGRARELGQPRKEEAARVLLVELAEELGDAELAERNRARLRELRGR
ncbi:ATP-binding protein [Kitasatospora sp. NPDC001527]|uniref:ATP-binding protein n=1 Tax=Kitasatospora sp. NPDC001527 TaxID=3154519 RepID=UPI00331BB0B2